MVSKDLGTLEVTLLLLLLLLKKLTTVAQHAEGTAVGVGPRTTLGRELALHPSLARVPVTVAIAATGSAARCNNQPDIPLINVMSTGELPSQQRNV